MPILDVNAWQRAPGLVCLKVLGPMIYPSEPQLQRDFVFAYSQHASPYGRSNQAQWSARDFLRRKTFPLGSLYSSGGLYANFIEQVRIGQQAGWLLWTAKRLYDADYRDGNINRAVYLLKMTWEAQNPGRAIEQESLLADWKNFQSVAHLWAAYWASREYRPEEFGPFIKMDVNRNDLYAPSMESRETSRNAPEQPTEEFITVSRCAIPFDLPSIAEDLPSFLAKAEFFRRFGESQYLLVPEKIWSVPKDFLLPNVEVGVSLLTDEENNFLAENQLTVDHSPVDKDDEYQTNNHDTQNIFRQEGDFWKIVYSGQALPPLRDAKGLHYIACLLGNPTQMFQNPIELVTLVNGRDATAIGDDSHTGREQVADSPYRYGESDPQPILDAQARDVMEQRIEDLLMEAAACNNPEKAAELREEANQIAAHLNAATGLHGRDRNFADTHDGARKAVSKAIYRALKTIDEHHPELAQHLRKALTPVSYPYQYRADPPIDWIT